MIAMRRLGLLAVTLGCSAGFSCNVDTPQFKFIDTLQYPANNPIEDRLSWAKLTSTNGYTVSVFDGHGGALMAEFASKNIGRCLDERIKSNLSKGMNTEKLMELSLTQAYEDLQNGFLVIFKQNLGTREYRRVGACALTAVILKDSIHIANAGDCEGILLGDTNFEKVNLRLNAGQSFEQERLKKAFPDQEDIYKCHPGGGACYVKGRLQPTRSLGDFYLKYSEYNFTNLKRFTGPYIEFRPLVTHFQTKGYKKLLLASDGLWDELQGTQIQKISSKKDGIALPKKVFTAALIKILERNKIDFEHLDKVSNRRNMHDDISIISVDLDQLHQTL